MRRWIWILSLIVVVFAAANTPVWGYYHTTDETEWTETEQQVQDPIGYETFSAECEAAFNTIKTTIDTYVSTVVTVVKAVVGALKTVLVSVVKFAAGFALTLVKALAQWLISALF